MSYLEQCYAFQRFKIRNLFYPLAENVYDTITNPDIVSLFVKSEHYAAEFVADFEFRIDPKDLISIATEIDDSILASFLSKSGIEKDEAVECVCLAAEDQNLAIMKWMFDCPYVNTFWILAHDLFFKF